MNSGFGNYSRRRMMGRNLPDQLVDIEARLRERPVGSLRQLADLLPDLVGSRIIATDDPNNTEPLDASYSGWVIAAAAQALADGNFTLAKILSGLVIYGIGEQGEFIRGVDFLSNHVATVGVYNRRVRRGFQEVGGKPAFLIEFFDDAAATNLITVNPGFESGNVTSGYVSYANWSADTTYKRTGSYSAVIAGYTDALETIKYGITAGNSYRFGVWTYKGSDTITIEAKWYNSVPSLIGTSTVFSGSIAQYSWEEHFATIVAPAGATQVSLSVWKSVVSGGAALVIDDLSITAVSNYAAVRWSDTGVEILDETGVIWSSASPSAEADRVKKGTAAITATEAYLQWQTTRKALFLYDGQRERALSEVGWLPYAYPIGATPADVLTAGTAVAANGGSVAIPMRLEAPMLLESASCVNDDLASERSWNWALYEQYLNNGNAAENTLTRVAYGSADDTFIASGTGNVRVITAASAPVYLPPGLYWFVFQNVHATNTFLLGRVGASTMNAKTSQTKTLSVPLAATLDFVAATWAKNGATWGVRLNGRVFGQTSAF